MRLGRLELPTLGLLIPCSQVARLADQANAEFPGTKAPSELQARSWKTDHTSLLLSSFAEEKLIILHACIDIFDS
jgi:hypothetical protein